VREEQNSVREGASGVSAVVSRDGQSIKDRAHGRLVTVPRKRPWTHLLWREGPRDAKPVFSREEKEEGATRGVCMTPSIRANGPSYLKAAPRPVERVKVRGGEGALAPLVLIRTVADRQVVVAVSEEARVVGVRTGMTLTEARALCAGVMHEDHDRARDERGLEALARWMVRFTPVVSVREGVKCKDGEQEELGDYLFLDLTGCERVFGGIGNIVDAVEEALSWMGVSFQLGVGETLGSAYAFAFDEGDRAAEAALPAIPVRGLRIDSETCAALHHLGIETIGQLMALPREALPARFGGQLLLRLDQALGRVAEPLVALPYCAPIGASMEFDGTVESLEVMWIALRQLLRDVVKELARRGCGAREVKAIFKRAYADPIEKLVRLSRASRNGKELFELLRCALEQVETDVGFTGVVLDIARFERVTEGQMSLVAHEEEEGEIELDRLVERVVARMGDEGLKQVRLLESYLPERAWEGLGFRVQGSGDREHPTRAGSPWHGGGFGDAVRPLQLLGEPVEVRVMVSPSDDRDGRPILFRQDQDVHELTHAVGPERISGEWWRGHEKTRDYFEVEDRTGKRFWMFRVNETGKWFLHGVFA
jgi:protein ImuB